MKQNGADSDKPAGFNEKPVTVALNGNQIEATHHITTGDNRLLHLYIDARDGGIDVTVPLCSDKPAYAHSDRGERALGLDTTDDVKQEHEIVTDGGRDAFMFARDVDYVEYDGDGYRVYGAVTREVLEICQVNRRPITVPVAECTATDVYGNPVDDDGEHKLVTDGGMNLRDPLHGEGAMAPPDEGDLAECTGDECTTELVGGGLCSDCRVSLAEQRELAMQCDTKGCENPKRHEMGEYCEECINESLDGVTACDNPACDGLAEPVTDTCSTSCAKIVGLVLEFLDGAGWDDLQLGGYTRSCVEDALDAHRENSGGEL